MKLSPAPNNYPSGTRPVAAAGAGVQFATGPNGERSGVRRKGGLVAFAFRSPVIRPTYLHARGNGREGITLLDVDRHAPGDSREETGTNFATDPCRASWDEGYRIGIRADAERKWYIARAGRWHSIFSRSRPEPGT